MSIASTAIKREGEARTPEGAVYIAYIWGAVPAGAIIREGQAYSPEGALYVRQV